MMYWHIDTDIVSLVVLCILHVYNRTVSGQSGAALRDRRFARCLVAGIAITIIDIAASIIMEVPTSRFVYHLLMTLYFIAIQAAIVEWILYAVTILYQNDVKRGARVTRATVAVYAVYAVFNALNPWTGMVYSLGPNGEYSRGPFFMLMVALYAAYVIALFVMVISRWKKIPAGYPGFVLLLVPVILALGIAVQLLNSGWLMIMPTFMICMLLTNQFLQNIKIRDNTLLVQKLSKAAATDRLTGIFNRAGAENFIHCVEIGYESKPCLIGVVDIDNLKVVNDTMGHDQGDRAIKGVADSLNEYFADQGMVSRYGGDEFLVCKTGGLTETQAHTFLRGLIEHLSKVRVGEEDEHPIHCSIGATLGVLGEDDFQRLRAEADCALYHIKRGGKNSYAMYRKEMSKDGKYPDSLTQEVS